MVLILLLLLVLTSLLALVVTVGVNTPMVLGVPEIVQFTDWFAAKEEPLTQVPQDAMIPSGKPDTPQNTAFAVTALSFLQLKLPE